MKVAGVIFPVALVALPAVPGSAGGATGQAQARPAAPPKPQTVQVERLTLRRALTLTVSPTPRRDQKRAFTSIAAALQHAAEQSAITVSVQVHPGTYPDNLRITRPTSIARASSVGGRVLITGSISNGDGHDLSLTGVEMRGCRPYALIQRGGALSLLDVGIHDTRTTPSDEYSGVAMDLGEGVTARLTDVSLTGNGGPALLAQGRETTVVAFNLSATGNRVHPALLERARERVSGGSADAPAARPPTTDAPPQASADGVMRMARRPVRRPSEGGVETPPLTHRPAAVSDDAQRLAAIDVAHGALLLADNPVIENNQFGGVTARSGARVHLRDGRVRSTSDFAVSTWSSVGGIDIRAIQHSRLELRNMLIADSTIGIVVSTSWLLAADLIVRDHAIGAAFLEAPDDRYDAIECWYQGSNQLIDNERNADFGWTLPVPDVGESLGEIMGEGERPAPYCPGVPWTY